MYFNIQHEASMLQLGSENPRVRCDANAPNHLVRDFRLSVEQNVFQDNVFQSLDSVSQTSVYVCAVCHLHTRLHQNSGWS